jgi:hypothetical protein
MVQRYDLEPDDPCDRPHGWGGTFRDPDVVGSLEEAQRNFKGRPVVKDENWT